MWDAGNQASLYRVISNYIALLPHGSNRNVSNCYTDRL